jgi:hypothetical protein
VVVHRARHNERNNRGGCARHPTCACREIATWRYEIAAGT